MERDSAVRRVCMRVLQTAVNWLPDSMRRVCIWMLQTAINWLLGSMHTHSPTICGTSKERAMLKYVLRAAPSGSPTGLVDTIDEFCSQNWMMNLGNAKGDLVDAAIKAHGVHHIKVALELGGYCGYSALRLHNVLLPASKIYSVEPDLSNASIQQSILEHAGVMNVEQVLSTSSAFIRKMHTDGIKVDYVFLDHLKSCYLPDIQKLVELDIMTPGALIVADNVLFPGAPEYKRWMLDREGARFRNKVVPCFLEYSKYVPDELMLSTFCEYGITQQR